MALAHYLAAKPPLQFRIPGGTPRTGVLPGLEPSHFEASDADIAVPLGVELKRSVFTPLHSA